MGFEPSDGVHKSGRFAIDTKTYFIYDAHVVIMRERNGGTIVLGNRGKMEYAFTKYLLAYTIQYIIIY